MNPLEKEVPSLETCKKLNWKGETAFVWVEYCKGDFLEQEIMFSKTAKGLKVYGKKIWNAPTPTEMFKRLPKFIQRKGFEKNRTELCLRFINGRFWGGSYFDMSRGISVHSSSCDGRNLKIILPKLCLWCEENDYV